jgi:hypothetical protein
MLYCETVTDVVDQKLASATYKMKLNFNWKGQHTVKLWGEWVWTYTEYLKVIPETWIIYYPVSLM